MTDYDRLVKLEELMDCAMTNYQVAQVEMDKLRCEISTLHKALGDIKQEVYHLMEKVQSNQMLTRKVRDEAMTEREVEMMFGSAYEREIDYNSESEGR